LRRPGDKGELRIGVEDMVDIFAGMRVDKSIAHLEID